MEPSCFVSTLVWKTWLWCWGSCMKSCCQFVLSLFAWQFPPSTLSLWLKKICFCYCINNSYVFYILLGFSDPYVMLGITPMGCQPAPLSPQPPLTPRALPDTGMDSLSLDSPDSKLRKHSSFRLSFKRKSQHRDSMGPMPAKIIKATSVKPSTLCPKWNEKFKLYVKPLFIFRLWL